MISGDTRYRVYNKCKYDIGVQMVNGLQQNIRPGSFAIMTVNDILYVETICSKKKFFAQKMLVPIGDDGKAASLEDFGIPDNNNQEDHLTDDFITQMLKGSVRKLEAWLETIEDPSELHAVFEVAKTLDLPASKLKTLKEKMPNKDWLDEQ